MPHYVTLTKIESQHTILSQDVYSGLALELPEVGGRFFMYTDSDTRYINTSMVEHIITRDDRSMVFKTTNSLYSLDFTPTNDTELHLVRD